MMKIWDIAKLILVGILLVFLGACGGSSKDKEEVAKNHTLLITDILSYVDGLKREGELIPNDVAKVTTIGALEDDIEIRVNTRRGERTVKPSSVSMKEHIVIFRPPVNVIDGTLSVIREKKVLDSAPYHVYKEYAPRITKIEPSVAHAGDAVTIKGKHLSDPVRIKSLNGSIDMEVPLAGQQVSFLLPPEAYSGNLYLQTQQGDTNRLYLMVKRDVNVNVRLAEGLDINTSSVAFGLGSKEYLLDEQLKSTIPIDNTLKHIFATVKQKDGNFSVLYSAVVLPDMSRVVLDAHSTAVSMLFVALGIDNTTIAPKRWRPLYDDISQNSKVRALSEYIVQLQGSDFEAWIDKSNPLLTQKLQDAIKSVMLEHKSKFVSQLSKVSDGDDRSLVIISQDPKSEKIYIDDAVSGKKLNNGSVTVVNKSRVYLSIEARSKKSGELIGDYAHIADFMNMSNKSLVAPSAGGIFNGENVQKIKLHGEDAVIEIIAGAYGGETAKTDISDALRARTIIDGVVIPSVNLILSALADKSIPKDKERVTRLVKGMSVVYGGVKGLYGGTTFTNELLTQLHDRKNGWPVILDTLFITPIKRGLSPCFSVTGFRGSLCGTTLEGVSIMLGLDPTDAVKKLGYAIASTLQKRALKRGVAVVPYVGWITATAFLIYDAYDASGIASDIATIGKTVQDARQTNQEFHADIDFKLKIVDVKPMCIAVKPEDTEAALYVNGERFLLEDSTSPSLYIGGQEAKQLDTATETKIYGKFDAQKLIETGSEQQLVFLKYGELLLEYDRLIQIVDQNDEGIYFNHIEPERAAKGATVKLKGCGWIPLKDVKVFFSKEDSSDDYVEAEIITKAPDLLTVKVPSNAKSGTVYVTTGGKITQKRLFDVNPFSLQVPDKEDTLAPKAPFAWLGKMLDETEKIYFIDHEGTKREGTIQSKDKYYIRATIPKGLSYGKLRIYAEDSDGIETNEITLPYVPLGVDADPSSQSFEGSITITLTQEDDVDIFYRIDDGAAQRYKTPITLKEEEAVYAYFSLYVWASVEVNGTKYNSNELEYKYTPKNAMTECAKLYKPFLKDADKYITFPKGKNRHMSCYYHYGKLYLQIKNYGPIREKRYYESGNLHEEKTLTGRDYPPMYNCYRDTDIKKLWYETLYDDEGKLSLVKEYYASGKLQSEHTWIFYDYSGVRYPCEDTLSPWRGIRDGSYTIWYETGIKKYEGNYKKGNKNGVEIYYYKSGQKESEKYYKDHVLDGRQRTWYENGQMRYLLYTINGVVDGLSTTWYETGQKKTEVNYNNGKYDGIYKTWYSTGKLKSEISYSTGKKDGIAKTWYETGKPKSEISYSMGEKDGIYKTWYENETLKHQSFYTGDKLNGESKWYSSDGVMTSCDVYNHGVKTGNCMP